MSLSSPELSHHRSFASDNYAGISPDALSALQLANEGHSVAYGEDPWTGQLKKIIEELFEHECSIFTVFNGTAANSLALAHLCRPYESILCHEQSHLRVDECGAPTFFSGGAQLSAVSGDHGKMQIEALIQKIIERDDIHFQPPRVLSLAQVTECGTLYRIEELQKIQEVCKQYGLRFHMDGARFANALVSLNVTPAEMTWKVGVDVLSFGFTKNGVSMGDLVVFFDPLLAVRFQYRLKQGGQLASKNRFLSAPMIGLLESGAWLKNALHANQMAALLEEKILEFDQISLIHPRQANSLFLELPKSIVEQLHQKGWRFYHFGASGYRLMTAWDHTEEDIDRFVLEIKTILK